MDMRPFPFTIKNILGYCIAIIVLGNCQVSQKSATQGISGVITEITGNQMPPASENIGTAVQRTLRVYAPTKISETTGQPPLFSEIQTTMIVEVKSDKKGHFNIQLPPGKYSVFVMAEELFYANSFNSDNFINLITVKPNEWTAIQLAINYSASF
jgi:hypothetical protein